MQGAATTSHGVKKKKKKKKRKRSTKRVKACRKSV